MRQSQKPLFALPGRDLAHILVHGAGDLESLRGQRLFIAGGTGFFGKWLVGALCHADRELDLGLSLTVLSRDPSAFLQLYPEAAVVSALRFEQGQVADYAREGQYDFLLHAATDTTAFTTEAEEQERSRAIISGTEGMVELSRKAGVRRFLNISSGAVYGTFAGKLTGAVEDDFAFAIPVTAYARAKREAEQRCLDSGLDFVTARAFAFLGPHLALDAHFAAGNFLRDAIRGGPILVRGDGTALRSYLHPADLVVWLLRLLVRGEGRQAYNVGSDEVVSTAELARLMADAVSPAPEVLVQSLQPQGPQNIYLPNIQRARQELNLEVWIPLREAIARTVDFLNAG